MTASADRLYNMSILIHNNSLLGLTADFVLFRRSSGQSQFRVEKIRLFHDVDVIVEVAIEIIKNKIKSMVFYQIRNKILPDF
jgi:hypothetical protein